jgi:hypothetical protein
VLVAKTLGPITWEDTGDYHRNHPGTFTQQAQNAIQKEREGLDWKAAKERASTFHKSEQQGIERETLPSRVFHTIIGAMKTSLQQLVSNPPGLKRPFKTKTKGTYATRTSPMSGLLLRSCREHMTFFCGNGNFGLLLAMIVKLPQGKRNECNEAALLRFKSEASAVLSYSICAG